jgi:hypothetical protein
VYKLQWYLPLCLYLKLKHFLKNIHRKQHKFDVAKIEKDESTNLSSIDKKIKKIAADTMSRV